MLKITGRIINRNMYMQKVKFSNDIPRIENKLAQMEKNINSNIIIAYERLLIVNVFSTICLWISI